MLVNAHRPSPGSAAGRAARLAAVVCIVAASMTLTTAADASAAPTVAQAVGALAHPATATPVVPSLVGPHDGQTPALPVAAPAQANAGSDSPSASAGAAPLQSALHVATQAAGAVQATGERVAAPAVATLQAAGHSAPATIVRSVVERAPVGTLAGEVVQRTTQLPQRGLAQTAQAVTRVLAIATHPEQTARTLIGGGSTVGRTLGGLAEGAVTVRRSNASIARPLPATPAPLAHAGGHAPLASAATSAASESGGPGAQRPPLVPPPARETTSPVAAGVVLPGLQAAHTTTAEGSHLLTPARTGALAPLLGTHPLNGGLGAAPSAAHDVPGGTPPPVAPPSPGGASPATAIGSGAGMALGLALLALLAVLCAPPAVRRLRLDDESWRRAPLMLIADRPG
jgi:hypothetical protein